jgi:colanic acid biosynthesis glycosyl transferase WcaI
MKLVTILGRGNQSKSSRKPLRVLVLAQYYPPDMGGASTRAYNVVNVLLSQGAKVVIVSAYPHYPLGDVESKYRFKAVQPQHTKDLKIYRVWIPPIAHSTPAKRILLHLSFIVSSMFARPFVGDYDVIWVANPNLFCFFSALGYGFGTRKPIVRNVDDLWPEVFYEMGLIHSRFARKVLDMLAWLSYKIPAAITPVSPGYKRTISRKYGISESKIRVVEVGVESHRETNAAGREINSEKEFTVMYSGVLGQGYDFDIVLEAARLLSGHNEIRFVIRGIGELAPYLQKQVRLKGLKNIRVENAFLSKAQLTTLLRSADVFLLPMARSTFVEAGLPTKAFEYQSFKKPVVVVSEGEPARYIERTKSGVVVNPGDSHALAETIIRLQEDANLRSELGRNGWEYVTRNLVSEKIGEKIYEVLSAVAS